MLPVIVATTLLITSSVDGAPVARARIAVAAASGSAIERFSNRRGRAELPAGTVRVRISASGCKPALLDHPVGDVVRVTLSCEPRVIRTVTVATGSAESLHRLPVPASELGRTAIASTPALYTDELLRSLPGFDRNRSNSAFTNYGQLRVSFGGAGADRGLVLANGIPAQDGFGGQIDWAQYPLSDIARVELLRGAGSALYGAGAIGGVLQIESLAPPSRAAGGSATLGLVGGSDALGHAYIRAGTPIGSHFSSWIALDHQQLAYSDLPPAYSSPIDRPAQSRETMESLRFRYKPNASAIVDAGYRAAYDDQQEGRPNYDFSRRLMQEHLRLRLPHRTSLIEINGYVRTSSVTNRADAFPQSPGVLRYTQDVPTSERGASIAWTLDHPSSTFELRADARSIYGDSVQYAANGSLQSAGSGNQQLAGLALQQTLRSKRTEIVAGARVDEVGFANGMTTGAAGTNRIAARIDRSISPRLAVRYDLARHLAARASIGGGFRAPFLNELVRGYQIGSVIYEPNSNLVPERSASRSVGLDFADAHRHISLDYTLTDVGNAIMFRTIDPTHELRSNVDRTQTDGMTLAYEQQLGTCSRLTASMTDQYARVVAGDPTIIGKRLQYVPTLDATIGFDGNVGKVQTGLSVSYMGQTFADDLNQQPLGTAVIAGVHAIVPLAGGMRLIASLQNITGAHYLSSIDRYGLPSIASLGIDVPLARERGPKRPSRCP